MDFRKDYIGKSILIVGGGTSTLDRNWDKLDYDFLWTCNDFYKNDKVLSKKIDLYQLGYETDITSKVLMDKLKADKPFVYYEPEHFRNSKEKSDEFIAFKEYIDTPILAMNIDLGEVQYNPAQKSGATFRMILLAMQATRARKVNFVGFDGFNKEFSNAHAFSGRVGLKETDTRRDWNDSVHSYVNIFVDAYTVLASLEDNNRLRNLGEGLDYNLGTELSKKYFPLSKDIYETIR
tara:strand:+ start:1156 stop:1860 length:705 start_codon:yes stop_codon:yes gene_type:complete